MDLGGARVTLAVVGDVEAPPLHLLGVTERAGRLQGERLDQTPVRECAHFDAVAHESHDEGMDVNYAKHFFFQRDVHKKKLKHIPTE